MSSVRGGFAPLAGGSANPGPFRLGSEAGGGVSISPANAGVSHR